MTDFLMPGLVVFLLLLGLIKKVDVLEVFLRGAKEGLRTGVNLLPTLLLLMTCVGMCRASGGLDLLTALLSPLTDRLGIPAPVTPLALLRPISGSGSLVLLEGILKAHGPDSTAGRVASVLMGSGETAFYVLVVYFGAVKVKRTDRAMTASLVGHLVTCLASAWLVSLFF